MSLPPDTFRIFVADLDQARVFYQDVIGWTLGSQTESWVYLTTSTIPVVLELIHPGHPEDAGIVGRFTGLSLASHDIHADFERLKTLGVSFTHAPSRRAWGGWLADFLDPSGNTLTLVQRE